MWHPDIFGDFGRKDEYDVDYIRKAKLKGIGPTFVESVKKNGIRTPVLMRLDDDLTILEDGHHRWFVAEDLDLEVPIIWANQGAYYNNSCNADLPNSYN